jgi:hypothetical protein
MASFSVIIGVGVGHGCVSDTVTHLGVYVLHRLCRILSGGGGLGATVKLLLRDRKVTCSSLGNNFMSKKTGLSCVQYTKMVGPLFGPCVCQSFSTSGCPFVGNMP